MDLGIQRDNIYIFDIEADNLYPYQKEVWTIIFKKYGEDKWLRLNPFKEDRESVKQKILDFIFEKEKPCIIAHNGLGYDQWVLWKEFGLDFRCGPDFICGREVIFFDTLFASQYLLPDREGGHSLDSWGNRVGFEKIDYRKFCIENDVIKKESTKGSEFKVYHPMMDTYCQRDVEVTERVFAELINDLYEHKSFQGYKLGQKSFYLMAAQEFTGVRFDKKKAVIVKKEIEKMMYEIKVEVDVELPTRSLKKSEEAFYKFPAKLYKADGSLTAHLINFLDRHNASIRDGKLEAYDKKWDIEANKIMDMNLPMNIEDQKQLKEYFLEQGWRPTMWNIKKDKRGKAIRDEKGRVIKTSPKIQENGIICPNLEEMEADLPKKIVKWMSLRNRLGVISGWLDHPRLEWDGRLPAGASGIASTHRQKHTVVANVPKAQDNVLFGKEFRSLFTSDEEHDFIGADQSGLEQRCQGHWTYRYDEGETARILIDGDQHSRNTVAFFPEETKDFDIESESFDKDDPEFKPYRSKSKNGGYAILYGCAPAKLAVTLGLPESKGKELIDAFWETNKSLKDLKDNVEQFWKWKSNKKWIPGVDGRRLYSRSQHSLINLLFQSTGSIIMDYTLALLDMKLGGLKIDELGRPYYIYNDKVVKRVIFYHDETELSVDQSLTEEVSTIIEWCMEESGRKLNLKIPLKGEAKIGKNWKDVH